MKKRIGITAAILLTLSLFTYAKWDRENGNEITTIETNNNIDGNKPCTPFIPKPANLYYDIGTRFGPMTKTELQQVTSIRDFFTEHVNEEIFTIESANIIVIINDKQSNIQAAGKGEQLTKAQLRLLQQANYSTNLKISTDVKTKNGYGYYSPHLTIVPETQARYSLGKKAFIEFLKEGNKNNTIGIDNDKLGFAKLYFTVNKNAEITNVKFDTSSGYENIDNAMQELLKNTPGKWTPAENAQGEKVDQELVISFGKEGC